MGFALGVRITGERAFFEEFDSNGSGGVISAHMVVRELNHRLDDPIGEEPGFCASGSE